MYFAVVGLIFILSSNSFFYCSAPSVTDRAQARRENSSRPWLYGINFSFKLKENNKMPVQ
jgi:hypothetical protein